MERVTEVPSATLRGMKKSAVVTKCLSLQHQALALQAEVDSQVNHPFRLETMLKEWILAFNKFGIGVWFEPSASPYIAFCKDTVEVRVHYRHLLQHGLHSILQMFHPVGDTSTRPSNYLEGTNVDEDWNPQEQPGD